MSYYKKIVRRSLSANNNCTSRQNVPNHPRGISIHECEHCNRLEEKLHHNSKMLSEKDEILEEMKNLVDWLKRDVRKANKRIDNLERGTETDEGDECNSQGEPEEQESDDCIDDNILEETIQALEESKECMTDLETRLNTNEHVIEKLQRQNQSLYEKAWELQLIDRENEKELKINKEIEKESEDKVQRLAIQNENLKYRAVRLEKQNAVVVEEGELQYYFH